MELVIIKETIELKKLTTARLKELCYYYSGTLKDIEVVENKAIIYIQAPSTWRLRLITSILLPYRYI